MQDAVLPMYLEVAREQHTDQPRCELAEWSILLVDDGGPSDATIQHQLTTPTGIRGGMVQLRSSCCCAHTCLEQRQDEGSYRTLL